MIRIATCLALATLISACASDLDKRYLDSTLGENLVLPPDLTRVEARSNFELPSNMSGDDPSARNRVPVLARVESLRLEGSGDHYWLSVEEPVDNLYQQVRNFWAVEGYRLALDEPAIGIMQTEWVLQEEGSKAKTGSFWGNLFSGEDLSATQDQFRTRIERDDGRSRIYIAHRGTEYKHVIQTGDRISPVDNPDRIWRYRQPEPELEIEMLSRLMIYLGLQQADVEQQKKAAGLFAPRAYMETHEDENSPVLVLKDSYQIAWNRVYHQLERLNFEIEKAEFKKLSGEGVLLVNTDVIEENEDEGGFFSVFSGSEEKKTKKFFLIVSEINHELTRVDIENSDGELDTTPAGAELMGLLYEQIR